MNNTSSSHSLVNPLLRDHDNVSPAQDLTLVVGYDNEGWPVFRCFRVGDLVESLNGNRYRVIGFSLSNTVFVKPHGLIEMKGISSVEFFPDGLNHADEPITSSEVWF